MTAISLQRDESSSALNSAGSEIRVCVAVPSESGEESLQDGVSVAGSYSCVDKLPLILPLVGILMSKQVKLLYRG